MGERRTWRGREKRKKYAGILISLFCLLFLFPLTGSAKEASVLEVTEKNPVTGEKLQGMELSLYSIAGFAKGDYQSLVYEEAFVENEAEITSLIQSDKQQEAVEILEKCIQSGSVTEHAKRITGEDGTVSFAGLEEGIYLLRCTGNQNTSYRVEQASVLVSIPMWGKEGELISDVHLEPKNEIYDPEKPKELSVIKVWKDDNNKAGKRPEKIMAGLYENNQLKEQVELSSKNNWSYEWKNLDRDAAYSVTELQVPEGYKLSVEHADNRYTLINTYTKQAENPQKQKAPETGRGPKTGDPAASAAWAVTALLALTVVCYLYKRKKVK